MHFFEKIPSTGEQEQGEREPQVATKEHHRIAIHQAVLDSFFRYSSKAKNQAHSIHLGSVREGMIHKVYILV